jgi:hypothetical protein
MEDCRRARSATYKQHRHTITIAHIDNNFVSKKEKLINNKNKVHVSHGNGKGTHVYIHEASHVCLCIYIYMHLGVL